MNTILVADGAGFIGSYLCERLSGDEVHVIDLDNFDNFYDPNQRDIIFQKVIYEVMD